MKKIFILLVLTFWMVGCGDKVDEKGFYTEGSKIGINKETGTEFDISGFDRTGYNEYGFDKEGFNRKGFDKYNYDKDGYNENGFNRERLHKVTGTTFNENGFDMTGFDKDGYGKNGYNKDHYDRTGFDVWGFDKDGYYRDGFNKRGYDRTGFDKEGYSQLGFNKNGIHKITKLKYDENGFDFKGIHKKTKNKYDEDGYDVAGRSITSTIKTSFFIGNYVNEFGDYTGKKFIGYNSTAQEIEDSYNRQKKIQLVISNNEISFRLSPYVFLNSDGKVSCSFKIDGKIYKEYIDAYKNEFYISKKYNSEKYNKFIKLFKNGKKLEIVVYNYDYTTHYKSSFDLEGFKELSEVVKKK